MVIITRGVAPCWSGNRSAVWARRQSSVNASSIRAPWSRGSRPSCPQPGISQVTGSQAGWVVGTGAANGIRVDRIRAASSAEQRPLIQAPPHWSGVMVRWRPWWAARASRSRACSSARSWPSGSMTAQRCRPALVSSEALRRLASSSITWTARCRSQELGRVSTARVITPALVVESQPWAMASATGVKRSWVRVVARRTSWGPVPRWPPVTAVRKSRVEAHPSALTALVASSSAVTVSSRASRVDLRDSMATTVSVSSLAGRAAHRVWASSLTCPRTPSSTAAAPPVGWWWVVLVMELSQAPTTDMYRAPVRILWTTPLRAAGPLASIGHVGSHALDVSSNAARVKQSDDRHLLGRTPTSPPLPKSAFEMGAYEFGLVSGQVPPRVRLALPALCAQPPTDGAGAEPQLFRQFSRRDRLCHVAQAKRLVTSASGRFTELPSYW